MAEIVAAILASSALTAGVSAVLVRRKTKAEVGKLDAETRSIAVEAAERAVRITTDRMEAMAVELERLGIKVLELEQRLHDSDNERERLRRQVERLHRHIDSLEAQMRAGGIDPPPRPRSSEETPT